MCIKGCSYHTVSYKKSKTRNNTIFITNDGSVGELHKIVVHNNECIIMYKKVSLSPVDHFADETVDCAVTHIKAVTEVTDIIHVASASVITGSCIILKVGNARYICFPPNYVIM